MVAKGTGTMASEREVLGWLQEWLPENYGISPEEIVPSASFHDKLNLDEKARLELANAANVRFASWLDTERAFKWKTIEDFVQDVKKDA
jgi:acyl carrier protein